MVREPARVRLELESHPENVTLGGARCSPVVAEAAALDDELLADLKTAVSEACNNVALHAYDSSGPMSVDVAVLHDGISIAVTDYGRGIKRIVAAEHRMGLGLAVISALADRAEFTTPERGGTEVRMWFARKTATTVFPAAALLATEAAPAVEQSDLESSLDGDIVAWVSPVSLTRYVLGRLFRTLAATSHFSVARVMDLQTVNDAISEYAEVAGHDGIGVALSSSSRRLVLTSGPFMSTSPDTDGHDGDTSMFSLLEARRHLLEGISDELNFEQLNDDELLHLVLTDAGRDGQRNPV